MSYFGTQKINIAFIYLKAETVLKSSIAVVAGLIAHRFETVIGHLKQTSMRQSQKQVAFVTIPPQPGNKENT